MPACVLLSLIVFITIYQKQSLQIFWCVVSPKLQKSTFRVVTSWNTQYAMAFHMFTTFSLPAAWNLPLLFPSQSFHQLHLNSKSSFLIKYTLGYLFYKILSVALVSIPHVSIYIVFICMVYYVCLAFSVRLWVYRPILWSE